MADSNNTANVPTIASSLTDGVSIVPSLFHRLCQKLCLRWRWRATRSRNARLTVVSQFFPPDFAATGQLLDDLTQRFASRGLQVQVLTGMPAYAYNRSDARRIEFQPNRCIRRTQASRLWPQRIRGRAVNGIFFCLASLLAFCVLLVAVI